jgi:hypothetical protein
MPLLLQCRPASSVRKKTKAGHATDKQVREKANKNSLQGRSSRSTPKNYYLAL